MNEKSPLEGLSWRQLPAVRREEVTLILGRMAGRQLGITRGTGAQDHERDGKKPLPRERAAGLAGCGQDPWPAP
ncbi:MAG: hypothetical protein OET79_02795 [Nitrospirota bacterium]|nr:hypothetical protein [Nitrospirota bacterium]